jgi:sugar phosphate isomerase/epimerase
MNLESTKQDSNILSNSSVSPYIGINSIMIKEISNGPIFANEVELIELNIDNPEVIKKGEINYDLLDRLNDFENRFSIHGPYASYCRGDLTNLETSCDRNLEVMKKVFTVADYLGAEYVVIHGDKVTKDYRDAMLEVIANLKQFCKLAKQYSITLLLENMVREKKNDRVGVLPNEVLQVIEAVNEENLKFCFDVGHANLAAHLYRFDILDYINLLSPYLYHMHIHDNFGISAVINEKYGDQHLTIGKANDYQKIFQALNKSMIKNMVLELHPANKRTDILRSISVLKKFREN